MLQSRRNFTEDLNENTTGSEDGLRIDLESEVEKHGLHNVTNSEVRQETVVNPLKRF